MNKAATGRDGRQAVITAGTTVRQEKPGGRGPASGHGSTRDNVCNPLRVFTPRRTTLHNFCTTSALPDNFCTTCALPDNFWTTRQLLHYQTASAPPDNFCTTRQPLHYQTTSAPPDNFCTASALPDNFCTTRQLLHYPTASPPLDNFCTIRQLLHYQTTSAQLLHYQTTSAPPDNFCTTRQLLHHQTNSAPPDSFCTTRQLLLPLYVVTYRRPGCTISSNLCTAVKRGVCTGVRSNTQTNTLDERRQATSASISDNFRTLIRQLLHPL